jgi:4'-phosphopantetheinyl transferase EntD
MIERLLPTVICAVEVRGDDPSPAPLPEEMALLDGAAEVRLAEFATSRNCARTALRQLGEPGGPILRGPKREPLWPDGIVGSITHCAGYRAAAVARASDVVTVGIDAEPHAAMPDRVVERVLSCEERAWLDRAPAGIHWARVIFSAKESVYKAWFPLARRWLGFDDAVVTIDPEAGSFRARLLVETPAGMPGELTGRYMIEDGLVVTAIAMRRL